jgi:hypothetical protein
MKFKKYWDALDPDKKIKLATEAATSTAYLSQVANGHRNAGANLIDRLLLADPKITYKMMRCKENRT